MINVIKDPVEAHNVAIDASFKDSIYKTYNKLVDILGEPSINEPHNDDNIQVKWVVEFNNKIFTIYDWKTYDREYTLNGLDRFNVGGTEYAVDFIKYLEKLSKK